MKGDIKQRLILAALELFAQQGINGVSMRNINVLAGTKNSGAAHYHFGNKLGLVEAVLVFLSDEVSAIRNQHFQNLQHKIASGSADADTILTAFYSPYIYLYREREFGAQAIKLFARLALDASPEIQKVVNRQFSDRFELLAQLLSTVLPPIDPNTLRRHILFSWVSAIHALANLDFLANNFYGDLSIPQEQLMRQFINFILNGMQHQKEEH